MMKFLLPLGIFIALVAVLAVSLNLDPREVPSPLIGKAAPEFSLPTVNAPDKTLSRADMLGKVWLLNAWASWCVACKDEHHVLLAISKDKLLPIYGLNYKDTRVQAISWLQRAGDPYEASLFDPDGRLGIDFGVYAVPETFLIDKTGTVRFKHIGALTPEVLNQKIMPLVRKLNA